MAARHEVAFHRRVAGEMNPAGFALAGLPRQLAHQRVGTFGQALERRLDLLHGGERMQPRGARPELGDGLRAAQQEHRDDRGSAAGVEMPAAVETVLVALAPAAVHAKDQGIGAQPVERFDRSGLGVVGDRVAAGLLVAGLEQRADRQRIEIRGRALLFHQRAEDARLDGVERSGIGHEVAADFPSQAVTR